MFFQITYTNGYCGCDVTEMVEAKQIKDAISWAEEKLYDYAENYSYVATGWGEDFEDEEQREMYYENCTFEIEEVTSEEEIAEAPYRILLS